MADNHYARRQMVALRQNGRCFYCGCQFGTVNGVPPSQGGTWSGFVRDHLVPKSAGGRDHNVNRVAACKPCDHRKGSLMPTPGELEKQWRILGREGDVDMDTFMVPTLPSAEQDASRTRAQRHEQFERVMSALKHLDAGSRVRTVLNWMSIEDTEEMLQTLEKSNDL
jgi:hypothetical protein